MKLYIDTSKSEKIIIKIDGQVFETEARREKSQRLLPFLNEVFKINKLNISDISEIEVNTGPGSFTGLRVGVSVASALAWSLGVPLNGMDLRSGGSIDIAYD